MRFIAGLSHHIPAAAGFCAVAGGFRGLVAVILKAGDISVSAIQRRLRVMPGRLSRAIDACYNLWLSRLRLLIAPVACAMRLSSTKAADSQAGAPRVFV